jgi:hypothetical protein
MARRHDEDEPTPAVVRTLVETPAELSALLICPSCGMDARVTAKLFSRVTRDSDGSGSLALKMKSPKAQHICDQLSMGLDEGARVK